MSNRTPRQVSLVILMLVVTGLVHLWKGWRIALAILLVWVAINQTLSILKPKGEQ